MNNIAMLYRRRIENICNKAGIQIYSVRVSDCFSDLGIVGAIAIEGDEPRLFNLSCRALGRNIEMTMLAEMKKKHKITRYRFSNTNKNGDIRDILGEYEVSWVDSGIT